MNTEAMRTTKTSEINSTKALLRTAVISAAIAIIITALFHYGFFPILAAEKYLTFFINHLAGKIISMGVIILMMLYFIPRADLRKASICLCIVFLNANGPGIPHLANPFVASFGLAVGFLVMNFIHKLLHPAQPGPTS